MALLDGCARLETAARAAEEPVKTFTTAWFRALHDNSELMSAAEGHLPRGGDMESRRSRLRDRLGRLAAMTGT